MPIATAAEQQSSVTDNIVENIVKISSITRENSARAAETNKSSTELSEVAAKLNKVVDQFKSENGVGR